MKVVPINNNEKKLNNEDSALVNDLREDDNSNNEKKIKFYRSISCCLTTVISLSIVLSILFITAVWVSTFSASLISLADSNRRNEFNKLELYFRQTVGGIESFGKTASEVLSRELEFYDLNKTENLLYGLYKAEYINTKGLSYFIFIVDADGNGVGFNRPEVANFLPGVTGIMGLVYPKITGDQFWFYFCKDFPKKEFCERAPLTAPDMAAPAGGNNKMVYSLATSYFGQTVWTPTYSDPATPGLLHVNMLIAFPTVHKNNGTDNAVFGYDFAASSMNIYLNESTLHLPGAVVIVIETSSDQIVASNTAFTMTCPTGCLEFHYSKDLLNTKEFIKKEKMLNNNVDATEIKQTEEGVSILSGDSFSRSLSHTPSSLKHSSLKIVNNKASFLQKFELGLENKDVTIVGMKLNNFGNWIELVDTKEIVSMTTLIFQTVQQLAKSGKGQVGSFENGFLTISFNAAIDADNHELKGCNLAKALTEKLTQLKDGKSQTTKPLPFTAHFAIVTDSVACGNLGTSEVKSFTIIGNIQKKIQEMLTKNLEFDISITISERVQNEIKEKFLSRCVEEIRFCNNKSQLEDLNVFELGESLHVAMDEWMYEMEQKESKNKWNNYNKGYLLYQEGNIKDALQYFEEHLLRNPNDLVGKKMIQRCQCKN
ncbi:hypothetical protein ABK040_003787 [Willaertia magna]